MDYLPLFLLFLAVLIAAYFYLQRAKNRTTTRSPEQHRTDATAAPAASPRVDDASATRPADRNDRQRD